MNLVNQTMYFQNHHFLEPRPHRVRGTSNPGDENGFWSKEMLSTFAFSRLRLVSLIKLWIRRICSLWNLHPSKSLVHVISPKKYQDYEVDWTVARKCCFVAACFQLLQLSGSLITGSTVNVEHTKINHSRYIIFRSVGENTTTQFLVVSLLF